jgi:hypothetical protein
MVTHNFSLTQDEFNAVERIIQRFERLAGPLRQERMGLIMDITACHTGACPLDLAAMVAGADADLAHDVAGIYRHFNRETGALEDCFSPRYAKRGVRA